MHPTPEERRRNALNVIGLAVEAVERGAASTDEALDAIAQVIGAVTHRESDQPFGFARALESDPC